MARAKKTETPAPLALPIKYPTVNFNISIEPQIKSGNDAFGMTTMSDYLWLVYECRINGSAPFVWEGKHLCRQGEGSLDEIEAFIGANMEYVTRHIHEVVKEAIRHFIEEARIAIYAKQTDEEKLKGIREIAQRAFGTAFTAPDSPSELYRVVASQLVEMCNRIEGRANNYTPVKKLKIHEGLPPLNSEQLKMLDWSYDSTLARVRKARKAPESLRSDIMGERTNADILEALSERNSPTDHAHKWDPNQIAIIVAARHAGVEGIGMSQWKTIRDQLYEIRKRNNKRLSLFPKKKER